MSAPSGQPGYAEFVLFRLEEMLCGIDILQVQEIKRLARLTPVPRSPGYVRGVVNMRGQIVTALDVRQRFGLDPIDVERPVLAIIIPRGEELLGLLVDEVEDVVRAEKDAVVSLPANVRGPQRHYLDGILTLDGALVSIVDKERIVEVGEQ
ncbi:MAG: purine-binding chemotaxis protein CheW [Deltaproteobacteria bacterium]|nr:purine-binding chemotaxis protein CheW [Deltaproteobacteria bacterium]